MEISTIWAEPRVNGIDMDSWRALRSLKNRWSNDITIGAYILEGKVLACAQPDQAEPEEIEDFLDEIMYEAENSICTEEEPDVEDNGEGQCNGLEGAGTVETYDMGGILSGEQDITDEVASEDITNELSKIRDLPNPSTEQLSFIKVLTK